MKRIPVNVVKAVVFSLIFLILFCTVSYILRPYSGSASRKNLCGFYAEENNSLEVVFLGASSVFSFWEPMEFWEKYGVTSYDFATGTMPPQMMKYCIDEIRKTQSPELIVIDLRTYTLAEKGYYLEHSIANMDHEVPLRNIVDNLKYSRNRMKMIQECVPDNYDKLPYYIDLIKYHTEWSRIFDQQSLSYGTNSSHDYLKGFKMVDDVKEVKFRDFSGVDERSPLSERLELILRELLDYCKKEDQQVLFLVNAYCQTKKEKKTYNYIADVVGEYGYSFLNANDYYQEIGLDFSTDYYDKSHTNIFGADKYTKFVGEYLIDHYELENHKTEKEYEQWNRDYVLWTEQTTELKKDIQEKINTRE